MLRKEIFIAPGLEAALIMIVALAGWISHNPLVFASLGTTSFEIIETPERPSALRRVEGKGVKVCACDTRHSQDERSLFHRAARKSYNHLFIRSLSCI